MNSRLQQCLMIMIFVAITGYCNRVFAQDASAQELGLTESDREKMIYSPGGEGETKTRIVSSTPTKDSVSTVRHQPAAQTNVKTKADSSIKGAEKATSKDQDQDSILSFNFLYYIIQKYKLQDIVD
jgi:hypothetical protein